MATGEGATTIAAVDMQAQAATAVVREDNGHVRRPREAKRELLGRFGRLGWPWIALGAKRVMEIRDSGREDGGSGRRAADGREDERIRSCK
jgi:hypothetical protein